MLAFLFQDPSVEKIYEKIPIHIGDKISSNKPQTYKLLMVLLKHHY